MLNLKQAEVRGLGRLTVHVKNSEKTKKPKSTHSLVCSKKEAIRNALAIEYSNNCVIQKMLWNGKLFQG